MKIKGRGNQLLILLCGVVVTLILCLTQTYSDILHGTVYYLITGFILLWFSRTPVSFFASGAITTVGIIAGFVLGQEEGTGPLVNRIFSILVIWFGVFIAMRYYKMIGREKESRSQLRAIFDNVAEAILLVSPDGSIVLCNSGAIRIFGYSPEEFTSLKVEDLMPARFRAHHPGLREQYAESPEERMVASGKEILGLHKTGREFPIELSLSSYVDKGRRYVIAFITDISSRRIQEAKILNQYRQLRELNAKLEDQVRVRTMELERALETVRKTNDDLTLQVESRKSTEEQLRTSTALYKAVARNFPDGIIAILNPEWKYVFVEGRELAGYLVRDQKNENRVFDGLHRFVLENYRKELKKSFEGNKVIFEVEVGSRYYEVIATPLRESERPASQLLVVIRNITRYKKYEAGLKVALDKERQLNALKSSFVSNVSHEFRTPLTTILSSLFLLENYLKPEAEAQRKNHINRIRRSVNTLTELLEDFLSLEKLSEGKVAVRPSSFDLKTFVSDFLAEIDPIRKTEQEISLSWKDDGDTHISTDKTILFNVLNNLVSNAIKYSPVTGKIKLDVEVIRGRVKISVRDNGMGIPKEDQEHIFERFFRGENAVNIQGTGLGLNLVQRYLSLLNGTVDFTSELNVGTTFIVEFPAVANAEALLDITGVPAIV